MMLAFALLLAADVPATTAAEQPEKKVCRSEEKVGSILPVRVCRTKAEWAEIAAQRRLNADQYKRDRASGNGVPVQQGQ